MVYDVDKSGDRAALALYLDNVDNTLESILSEHERPQVGKYWRLLHIYRDREIRRVSTDWVRGFPESIGFYRIHDYRSPVDSYAVVQ